MIESLLASITPRLIAIAGFMIAVIVIFFVIKKWGRLEEREKAAAQIIKGDLDARKIDDQVARTDADELRSELLRKYRREHVHTDQPGDDRS